MMLIGATLCRVKCRWLEILIYYRMHCFLKKLLLISFHGRHHQSISVYQTNSTKLVISIRIEMHHLAFFLEMRIRNTPNTQRRLSTNADIVEITHFTAIIISLMIMATLLKRLRFRKDDYIFIAAMLEICWCKVFQCGRAFTISECHSL